MMIVNGLKTYSQVTCCRTWATDAPLDPRNAVGLTLGELCELADRPEENGGSDAEWLIYVPRIPINTVEARTMMTMMNCIEDGTMYAGYTNDELAVLPGGAEFSWTVRPDRHVFPMI